MLCRIIQIKECYKKCLSLDAWYKDIKDFLTWEYIGKWQHGRYSYKPQNKSGLMQEAYLTKYYVSIYKIYTNYTFCKHKISSSHKRIIRGVNFWQLYLIMSSIHAKDSANAICYKTKLNWRPFYEKHTY